MAIHTPEWVKDAIFYQIFPDRFARGSKSQGPSNLEAWDAPPTLRGFKGGDFAGMLERLDYLTELGITAIYFNPIFQSAANHRYHTHDYFRVDPILGGDEAFLEFLHAAHARGIRVILDGVFNHASRGFLQFNHLMENGAQSPYVDWFKVESFPLNAYEEGAKPNYACWWDIRELPKLNTETAAVREFLFRVAEHWLKLGIDGWRLDVPLEISTPGFWEEFRRRVKAINPEAYILAEIWHEAGEWLQGDTFDATMAYGFNRACYSFFGGEALDTTERPGGFQLRPYGAYSFARAVRELLTSYNEQVTQVQYNLLSSHDEPRFLTMVHGDRRRLLLATLFQMSFPGTPSIYYGDEIGMEGGRDPDCRRGFPWQGEYWDQALLQAFQDLVQMRKAHAALRRGSFTQLHAKGRAYAFARQLGGETLVVAVNAGEQPASISFRAPRLSAPAARWDTLFGSSPLRGSDGTLEVELPALAGGAWIAR